MNTGDVVGGHHQIRGTVGQGGMATLYQDRHDVLGSIHGAVFLELLLGEKTWTGALVTMNLSERPVATQAILRKAPSLRRQIGSPAQPRPLLPSWRSKRLRQIPQPSSSTASTPPSPPRRA